MAFSVFADQAPKFCTLVITVYRYCDFDLVVSMAKIVQNFLETAKKLE